MSLSEHSTRDSCYVINDRARCGNIKLIHYTLDDDMTCILGCQRSTQWWAQIDHPVDFM